MAQNFDDLIEQIRTASPMEDIVAETSGFTVTGHGRYLTTREHDSLRIDTHNDCYFWYSKDEKGDVYQWVMLRNNWDFKSAVEYLCKRGGLAAPEWGGGSPSQRIAAREKQDVFDIAQKIFTDFFNADEAAKAYAKNRGWTDATIKEAHLGFSGNHEQRAKVRDELRAQIIKNGGDPESPAAVALIGYSGDMQRWCKDHDISTEEAHDYIENGYIAGMIGKDLLIYPHFFGGRINYFSGRKIHYTEDDKKESRPKTYNMYDLLVGPKQIYLNWLWSRREDFCVLVEGQANAITLGQWGIPSVALMGLGKNIDEHLAHFLGAKNEKHEINFFLALDSDEAGRKNTGLITSHFKPGTISENNFLKLFGPKMRLLTWKGIAEIDTYIDLTDLERNERDVTDANDLLRGMML